MRLLKVHSTSLPKFITSQRGFLLMESHWSRSYMHLANESTQHDTQHDTEHQNHSIIRPVCYIDQSMAECQLLNLPSKRSLLKDRFLLIPFIPFVLHNFLY